MEEWTEYAQTLGYKTQREMLNDLYSIQKLSIGSIAKRLGVAPNTVRIRLAIEGINVRSRGGPNYHGTSVLRDAAPHILKDVHKAAAMLGVHPSTVYKERRRRACNGQEPVQQNTSTTSVETTPSTSSTPPGGSTQESTETPTPNS